MANITTVRKLKITTARASVPNATHQAMAEDWEGIEEFEDLFIVLYCRQLTCKVKQKVSNCVQRSYLLGSDDLTDMQYVLRTTISVQLYLESIK